MTGIVVAVAAVLAAVPLAQADTFPTKQIRMTIPLGPGSPTDAYARVMARQMEKQMGQPIVVENLPGAAGIIGTRTLVRAAPDGYTIGLVSNGYVSHHLTSNEVQYRWPQDFVLVHQGVDAQETVLVSTKAPVKTLPELVAYAKANPGKLNIGDPGSFTSPHIISEMFQYVTGVKFTQVTYKTSAEMIQALHRGEIDLTFVTAATLPAGVTAGTWRAVALLRDTRSPGLPDIPTAKEQNVNLSYKLWLGFALPKGTPQDIADRWTREVNTALDSAEVKKFLDDQKMIAIAGSKADMQRSIDEEMAALKNLIEVAKIPKM